MLILKQGFLMDFIGLSSFFGESAFCRTLHQNHVEKHGFGFGTGSFGSLRQTASSGGQGQGGSTLLSELASYSPTVRRRLGPASGG